MNDRIVQRDHVEGGRSSKQMWWHQCEATPQPRADWFAMIRASFTPDMFGHVMRAAARRRQREPKA